MTDFALQPLDLQNGSYTAQQDRLLLDSLLQGEGVVGPFDFQCSASSLTVTALAGEAYVKGTTNSYQGIYNAVCTTSTAVTVATNSGGGNPRVDQIVLRIYDKTEAGGLYDKAAIEVVQGSTTVGATLDNRSGVGTLPASCILLADVLLAAAGSTISAIRDRRRFVDSGVVPNFITTVSNTTAINTVSFVGASGNSPQYVASGLAHATHDTKQVAHLQYLPKRIVGATKIKFRLGHSATQLQGSYVVSIYDASGRLVVSSTNPSSFSGAASTSAIQSATITATTFEAGLYYVHLALDTSAGAADLFGYHPYAAYAVNMGFYSAAGTLVIPTVLVTNATTPDITAATPAVTAALPTLPVVTLSVG